MTKRKLPSDPEFLLKYIDDIDSDCSDDEFKGYVDEDEEAMDVSDEYRIEYMNLEVLVWRWHEE